MPTRLTSETRIAVAPLLVLALNSAKVGVVVKADDGTYIYASGLPDYFPEIVVPGARDEDLFEGDWLDKIRQAQQIVLQRGETVVLQLTRANASQFCVCECTVQRYEIPTQVPAFLMTFTDLTPERKREDTLKALLREVSHRSKNLLAIVQSIATQTANTSEGLDVFVTKFRGRLDALSAAQDLVTESNWNGARFRHLATNQLQRFVEEGDPRVKVLGENPMLSPNGATHIGLALHELITNSVAFGALASRRGELTLRCGSVGGSDFVIDWNEKTDPSHSPSENQEERRHPKLFGSTVLERVVPAALQGRAEYSIVPGQVTYRLSFNSP